MATREAAPPLQAGLFFQGPLRANGNFHRSRLESLGWKMPLKSAPVPFLRHSGWKLYHMLFAEVLIKPQPRSPALRSAPRRAALAAGVDLCVNTECVGNPPAVRQVCVAGYSFPPS